MVTNQLEGPRALTLRAPWGTAIARLGKNIENRTWRTSWRGRIYLHQGNAFSEHGMHDQRVRTAWQELTGDDVEVMPYSALPTGVILGRADVVDCHRAERRDTCCGVWADRVHDDLDGPARHRLVHWRLENVETLDRPVPCSGGQGLWLLDERIAAIVDARIEQVPERRPRRAPLDVTAARLRRHMDTGELTQAQMVLVADLLDRLAAS